MIGSTAIEEKYLNMIENYLLDSYLLLTLILYLCHSKQIRKIR